MCRNVLGLSQDFMVFSSFAPRYFPLRISGPVGRILKGSQWGSIRIPFIGLKSRFLLLPESKRKLFRVFELFLLSLKNLQRNTIARSTELYSYIAAKSCKKIHFILGYTPGLTLFLVIPIRELTLFSIGGSSRVVRFGKRVS